MQKEPVSAKSIQAVKGQTNYPAPYADQVAGRCKRKLGDFFGLKNFGINQTILDPGSVSALSHHHSKQDEFIYVLEGELILILDGTAYPMLAGDCIGLPAGTGLPHQLINRSNSEAVYLEIGDRSAGDEVECPDDDIKAAFSDGRWTFYTCDPEI